MFWWLMGGFGSSNLFPFIRWISGLDSACDGSLVQVLLLWSISSLLPFCLCIWGRWRGEKNMILLSSHSQLLVQPRLLFSFISASLSPRLGSNSFWTPHFSFETRSPGRRWPQSSNAVSQPAFICSFHPPPHLSVCLSVRPSVSLASSESLPTPLPARSLRQWGLSGGGSLPKPVLVSSHVHLCDNSLCFPKNKKKRHSPKIYVRKIGIEWRRGRRGRGENHSATAGFYHEWVGVSVRGTIVRADGLISSYPRINFISYVLLICPLVK